ncbi:MAG: hypothetical protein U9Q82_10510 [Chloroflexota bacterium]|nr:hypothetical protein [Chloroflexota bacterium]
MPKTYTFHVSLPGTGRVWRKIEMLADQTLEDLHFAIQSAYDWDSDHMYSFFMSGKAWDNNTEYCLPEGVDPWGGSVDVDEEEDDDELPETTREELEANLREFFDDEMTMVEIKAFWDDFFAEEETNAPGDVRTTTIESLALEIGKTFMYLFDYGDEWRFKLRVHAIDSDAPKSEYPKIVESVGEAPSQYPDWE